MLFLPSPREKTKPKLIPNSLHHVLVCVCPMARAYCAVHVLSSARLFLSSSLVSMLLLRSDLSQIMGKVRLGIVGKTSVSSP